MPKKRVPKSGFGDRQVGAFSVFGVGVYRNPVHFLAKKGLKIRNRSNLGVDVIQPRDRSVSGPGFRTPQCPTHFLLLISPRL